MPQSTGRPASSRSPWSASTAGNPCRTVRWCAERAPACLPAPMTSILTRPLSTSPWKSVCGLTRFTTITPSASARSRDAQTGTPKALSPTDTTSIDETTSAPTLSAVTPRSRSTARCPSAVAPPWLPMHGATKGSPPASRTAATAARRTAGRSAMPLLPAVIPTRAPRVTSVCRPTRRNPLATSPGTSTDAPGGYSWSTSCRRGPSCLTLSSHTSSAASAAEPTTSHTNPKEAQACTVPNAATTPAAPSSAPSAVRTCQA